MGGGLMQIITHGTQDLSLTGNPQITFFRIVYRRYTNFGKKIIETSFNNSPDFYTTSYLNIPKNNGDLLTKLILKIKLPKIDLSVVNEILGVYKNENTRSINNDLSYYDYLVSFINNLKNLIKIFFQSYANSTSYNSYIMDLKNFILNYVNNDEYQQFFNTVNYFYNNNVSSDDLIKYNSQLYTNASLFKNENSNLVYIYELLDHNSITYDGFKFLIEKNIEILEKLNVQVYDMIKLNSSTNKIKICWVNKIATYIFNSIDLYIGSNKIYSLSDTYINNYSELYYKNKQLYNRLIGNDIWINKYNEVIDETILYLPIPFWNLSNYGLAFPLISLQFNSLQIKINTKKLFDCVRIDTGLNNTVDKNEIINLLTENFDVTVISKLEMTMLLEYIYLDSVERNKFARSAHEYLIEQVQQIEFNKISPNNNQIQLDIFHCCKDMFWFVQKKYSQIDIFNSNINVFDYIYPVQQITETNVDANRLDILKYSSVLYSAKKLYNPFTFNQGLYIINNDLKYLDQLTIIIENILNQYIFPSSLLSLNNIILESFFYLNGTQLFGETSNYFNYLQPHSYYNSSPQIGLNTYSFCLSPTEFQPTGSCNMSRISYIGLKLKINEKIEDNFVKQFIDQSSVISTDEYKLTFQTRNFNVLRIIGGIGATAYTYN